MNAPYEAVPDIQLLNVGRRKVWRRKGKYNRRGQSLHERRDEWEMKEHKTVIKLENGETSNRVNREAIKLIQMKLNREKAIKEKAISKTWRTLTPDGNLT